MRRVHPGRRHAPAAVPIPVTFTIQIQLAAVWICRTWAPVLVCAVTDCPDAAVPATAGLPLGVPPGRVTKTWKAGPDAGGGAH